MIVTAAIATPPETLAAWLDGLGTFDDIRPAEAAERWGVGLGEAFERLHAMVGGPLEIPAGKVEVYRRAVWVAPEIKEAVPLPMSRDHKRLERVRMIPRNGARMVELCRLWGLAEKSCKRALQVMRTAGLVVCQPRGKCKVWMPA